MKKLFIGIILIFSTSSFAKQAKIKCYSITGEFFQEYHIDFNATNLKRYPSDNFAFEITGKFIKRVTNGIRPPPWDIEDALLK